MPTTWAAKQWAAVAADGFRYDPVACAMVKDGVSFPVPRGERRAARLASKTAEQAARAMLAARS